MSKPEYSQPSVIKSPASLRVAQIVLGIATLGFAGLVMMFPGFAVYLVAVWLSVSLMFAGVEGVLVGAGAMFLRKGTRIASIVIGAGAIAASVVALVYPGAAILTTLVLLAIGLSFLGSGAIARGTAHKWMPGWTRAMLIGVGSMTVITSGLIAIFPAVGVQVLITIVEVALIINGSSYIATGAAGVIFREADTAGNRILGGQ